MKPDPLIERELRALSPETKAAASQVDDLITALEAIKAKMLFEPTRDIDARIGALREKKQKLLSGEVDGESAQKAVPAPPTLILPIDLKASKDPVTNPFNTIDVLPSEEAELRPILKQALKFGMEHVNKTIAEFRPMAGKYQNTPVSYTQGEHLAVRAALGMLWTETRQLLKFAREKRQALEARVNGLEERAAAMKYVGVWHQDHVYGAGNFVTDGGSMFHAQRGSVGERPGTGNDAWVLAVKKGKDAK